MKTLIGIELDKFAYDKFIEHYNFLDFIPDFKIRMSTAKQNFKKDFLADCNCENCTKAVNLIINTTFNESE